MTGSAPSPPSRRIRRRGQLLRCLAAVLAVAASVQPSGASAQAVSSTYSAVVDANGVNIRIEGAGLPLTSVIDVSPWAALARLDNTQSLGQAGLPYLGDFITPLIGTVNGLGGGGTNLPPLPTLPGYVSSSFPQTPSSVSENAGFLLQAESEQRRVHSTVQVGFPAVGTEGNSTIFADAEASFSPDGVLTARAEAGVSALDIGGVLRIGDVSSSIDVVDDGVNDPQIAVHTGIGLVTVLGYPIGIDEDGITVLGNNAPLLAPIDRIVNEALERIGVTLRLVPSSTAIDEDTGRITSVTSGVLEIGIAAEVPVLGRVSVRYTVGRASISFLNRPFAPRPATATTATTPPAPPDSGAPASAAVVPPPTVARPPAASASSVTQATAPPSAAAATEALPANSLFDPTSFTGLYLVLVLAAAMLVGPAAILERAGLVARRIWP